MSYGPDNKYPYRAICATCSQDPIYVQYSVKKEKEYATNNKKWEKGTNNADFHKCFKWKKSPEGKESSSDSPPTTADQSLSMKDRLILVEKGLKKLASRMDDFEQNWS